MLYHDILKNKLIEILDGLVLKKKLKKISYDKSSFGLEIPQKNQFGDVSSNIAMVFSKKINVSPLNLAEIIKNELVKIDYIKEVQILKPGFVNIFCSDYFWHNQLKNLLNINERYDYQLSRKRICVEFVSANPTGLMHIGHARGAVLGDTISSILEEVGHSVFREYYINDAGEQIKKLTNTVIFHINAFKGKEKNNLPDDLYPGEYLKKIAKKFCERNGPNELIDSESITNQILNLVMTDIKNDLKKLRIKHNLFVSEKKISTKTKTKELKNQLIKMKLAYYGFQDKPKNVEESSWQKEKQFLFRSKKFGDDSDRALIKPNGELTYFMSDIIYHQNKLYRNFDTLINVWGVDHSGYVLRLKNSLAAINKKIKYEFKIKLTSLVNLLENKKILKMSKRSGNYVTLRDVVKRVGVDVLRFMMISRNAEKKIDFDFEIILKKNKENPVFYVQYAFARCQSILSISKKRFNESIDFPSCNLSFLKLEEEKILIKYLCNFYNVVLTSALTFEPHRITNYLYDLSKIFHTYWGLGNSDAKKKILLENNKDISMSRLALVYAISLIIKKGLSILKIDCPESM